MFSTCDAVQLEERARAFPDHDPQRSGHDRPDRGAGGRPGEGARGLLLGSYASGPPSSRLIRPPKRLSLWSTALLRRLMRFGLPTMPAEFALPAPFVDRIIIVRSVAGGGGLYLAVKFGQGVNVLVRGFRSPWPPLAPDPRRRRGPPRLRGGHLVRRRLRLRRHRHVAALAGSSAPTPPQVL
jgi:hypothetical protein